MTDVTARKRSLPSRIAGMLGTTAVTLTVLAGAGLAVHLGSAELMRRADAAPAPAAAALVPVEVQPIAFETGYDVRRAFVGQVEAAKASQMSFEFAGRLAEIAVEEGERVAAGQFLARLDTALLEAERDQLQASRSAVSAQLTFADQTLDRTRDLRDRGHATQADLDGALARRDELRNRITEIDAGLGSIDIRLGKSTLTAPFDGRVTMRNADGGESLSPGQPVLGLVQDAAPQVRVGLPLDLDADRLTSAQVEIDAQTYTAQLLSLRPDIDPVTRTRTAIFALSSGQTPTFGQTARLVVEMRVDSAGLWVPTTTLNEGLRGQWTLLTVDTENVVRSASVEVLHAESDRVYVRGGFPEGARLITEGPQRVTVGQTVTVN